MNGSTAVSVATILGGVLLATTIFSRRTTAPNIQAGGDAISEIALSTLGINAVPHRK